MLSITPEQRALMSEHGEQTYPHECCGFLLGRRDGDRKRVEAVRRAGNAREDSPQNRYLITPEEMLRTEREARQAGQSILGFYHSHPDVPARPSQYDLTHAWPVYSFVIMSVRQGKATEMFSWVLVEDGSRFEEEAIVVEE